MKIKKLQKNKISGFTLIEIMVATSIFVVVMLVAMGSLIMVSGSAKKAKALNFTMDNLNFAMESMTRSIRMGTDYYCSNNNFTLNSDLGVSNCSGSYKIAFKPSENFGYNTSTGVVRMAYYIQERTAGSGIYTIKRCSSLSNSCVDIISENINIDDISRFYVKGAVKGEGIQPSVYMAISGSVTIKNEKIPFAIQTLVSQRTLER